MGSFVTDRIKASVSPNPNAILNVDKKTLFPDPSVGPVPTAPNTPNRNDPNIQDPASVAARADRRKRRGRASTILTSASGLGGDANLAAAKLLGQ